MLVFVKRLLFQAVAIGGVLGALPAPAQTARQAIRAQRRCYQARPAPTAARPLPASGFLGDGCFRAGVLRTVDGQRQPVPGLRYHAGCRVLEAQPPLGPGRTQLWPVGSLRGFDIEQPGASLRRFRPRLVREGVVGSGRREFVEVLTTLDAGPLLVGWLFVQVPAAPGRAACPPVVMQLLVAGPGPAASAEGLRPLELTKPAVLRLFGARAEEVRSFAAGQRLHYNRPADVARMVDYFNRVALVRL